MIKLTQIPYDSTFFKKNVWKVVLKQASLSSSFFDSITSKHQIDILYCFTTYNPDVIKLLELHNFSLISIRLSFSLQAIPIVTIPKTPNDLKIITDSNHSLSHTEKVAFAKTIYKTSRYYKDQNLRNRSLSFYTHWIENSLHDRRTVSIFAYHKEKPLGMLLMKKKGKTAHIDLIGVLPSEQDKGVGSAMLQQGMAHYKKLGCESLSVITEAENTLAVRFYEKHGFLLNTTEFVYHKHL